MPAHFSSRIKCDGVKGVLLYSHWTFQLQTSIYFIQFESEDYKIASIIKWLVLLQWYNLFLMMTINIDIAGKLSQKYCSDVTETVSEFAGNPNLFIFLYQCHN